MDDAFKDGLLRVLQYFHNTELVGSMLLLYVIHKVSQTVNIPHAFLNGLKVIIAPTEDAVLRLRPDSKGARPEPLRQKEKEGKNPDAFDKMNALGLVRLEISRGTLGMLPYFSAYESMVTWSILALGNFFVAQTTRCAFPAKKPIQWATLILSAALVRALWCNVRLVGLLGFDNDHCKFAAFCGFLGLFVSAALGGMSPSGFFFFDFRLASSTLHFWGAQAARTLSGSALPSSTITLFSGISEDDFKAALFLPTLAVLAACVTTAAALPSIRFAQYYQRALQRNSGASFAYRALLIVDIVLPWIVTLAWIRPVSAAFFGRGESGASEAWEHSFRVIVTLCAVLARLALGRSQLQEFLDGAKGAVLQELREKKVNVQVVRSKFEARFQYLIIAAAQYAAPALTVLLSLALLLHVGNASNGYISNSYSVAESEIVITAGESGETGAGLVDEPSSAVGLGICDAARWAVGAQPWRVVVADIAAGLRATARSGRNIELGGDGGAGTTEEPGSSSWLGKIAENLMKLPGLPEAFWFGVTGFLTWWACFSWAATYAIGVVFWALFPEEVSVSERKLQDRTTKGKRDKASGKGKGKARSGVKGGGGKAPVTATSHQANGSTSSSST